MQVDKINCNTLNIQTPQKLENQHLQATTSTCENNIETSIYNQKGVQLPFCGWWSKPTHDFTNECIELLQNARNGRYKTFTPSDIKKILESLNNELVESERPNIIKEAFCLTCDEVDVSVGKLIDLYNIDGDPIPAKFLKKLIHLNAGRSAEDRLAILEFAKYELDNGATVPLGAFFKLPESRLQELIPFLRRITDINSNNMLTREVDTEKYCEDLYEHFRSMVYAIDDLSKPGKKAKKQAIKNELVDVTVNDNYFERVNYYPDEKTKKEVLNLVKDMNQYILESIV